MRILKVVEQDGAYVAGLAEAPDPIPAAGEVLVRVAASGINRADLSQIAGRYPPPPGEPSILGLEVSGRIVESGEPVCAILGGGGYAELVAVPAGQILPAPAALSLVAAAGIPEAYLTAFVNLVVEAGVGPGDRVLIHAGASGVGLAAVQLARLLGAEVAATTRSPEKQEALATAGATLGIAGPRDFAAEIESRWGPDAVDVVLDPVGAATLPGDVRVLAPGGRIVVIATMGGARSEIDLSLLMRKRLRLVGSTLRSRSRSEKAALVAAFRERVFSGFEAGRLRVVVDSVYSPERAALGLARMRANANTGKLLIAWDGP